MAGWTNIKTIRTKSKLQPRRSRVTQTPRPVWKTVGFKKKDAEMLRHTEV